MRQCGECTLCCKLLPVRELGKGANTACKHSKFKKGCMVYDTTIPLACRLWNCRWLVDDDTADQSRPDRAGYVIDIMPDFVTVKDNETGQTHSVQVVQIWVANHNRALHRTDKNLMAYMERRGQEGKLTLLRYDNREALTVIPPAMNSDGTWHEVEGAAGPEHTPEQILRGAM